MRYFIETISNICLCPSNVTIFNSLFDKNFEYMENQVKGYMIVCDCMWLQAFKPCASTLDMYPAVEYLKGWMK